MIVAILLVVLAALTGYFYLWPRVVRPELHHIVGELTSTVTKLETFVAAKEVQIADHLEEIALHNRHVDLKSAEREWAQRIRDKLNELLS